ncbi:hypothetical protein ZIOFF_060677 [Zingiber officinale]|uniref:Uncharacterized protein n=1 Tax=Zingiber officinale TaxID=94328 RepID=A0A8J5FES8_ZINOF|nr:hypothetical protein ZIOFF_060677 [Zingiber officinale]
MNASSQVLLDLPLGKMWLTLFEVFDDDTSPKVKKFMKFLLHKFHRHGNDDEVSDKFLSIFKDLVQELLMQKLSSEEEDEEVKLEEVYSSSGNHGERQCSRVATRRGRKCFPPDFE